MDNHCLAHCCSCASSLWPRSGWCFMSVENNRGTKRYRAASKNAVRTLYEVSAHLEVGTAVEETAVWFWHQFFGTRSLQASHSFPVICASLSLACKCCDSYRSVKVCSNLLVVCFGWQCTRSQCDGKTKGLMAATGHHIYLPVLRVSLPLRQRLSVRVRA